MGKGTTETKEMSEKKQLRKIWEGTIACASCQAPNSVKIEKEIITPAEPADFEIRVTVTKPSQRTLEESSEVIA